MRLWAEQLLSYLDRQRILGLHREVCALRGNGWGKKHSTVDYVFKYPPIYLYVYHLLVMKEMKKRGYKVDESWEYVEYRGKNCKEYNVFEAGKIDDWNKSPIYLEHDQNYLDECVENLKKKGVVIKL